MYVLMRRKAIIIKDGAKIITRDGFLHARETICHRH